MEDIGINSQNNVVNCRLENQPWLGKAEESRGKGEGGMFSDQVAMILASDGGEKGELSARPRKHGHFHLFCHLLLHASYMSRCLCAG